MIRTCPLLSFRGFILPCGVAVVAILGLMTAICLRSAQNPAAPQNGVVLPPPSEVVNQAALASPKPKDEPRKSKLEKTKSDAENRDGLARNSGFEIEPGNQAGLADVTLI